VRNHVGTRSRIEVARARFSERRRVGHRPAGIDRRADGLTPGAHAF
jgi:hypothetical protein